MRPHVSQSSRTSVLRAGFEPLFSGEGAHPGLAVKTWAEFSQSVASEMRRASPVPFHDTGEASYESPNLGPVRIDLPKGAVHGWCPYPQQRGFHSRRRTSDHKVRGSYY